MKHLAAVAVACAFAVSAGSAGAASFTTRTLSDAHVGKSKTELVAQKQFSVGVVRRLSGSWLVAPRHPSCWDHVPWAKLCNRARHKLVAHRWLEHVAATRLDAIELRELLRSVGTYLGAVAYVERYFGPQSFLRSCPNGEGGFGAWVYIGHASYAIYGANTTPGGWLQFMGGTFYGIIDEALAAAEGRGMRVPPGTRSWFSPLGQALAGRQMVEDGRRGEWTGPNC